MEMNCTTISVETCPIKQVVVYREGAEITREVAFNPTEKGGHIIIIDGVSAACQPQSIRLTGTGGCEIQDVTTEKLLKSRKGVNGAAPEIKELLHDLKKLQEKKVLTERKKVITKEKQDLLKKYTETALCGHTASNSPNENSKKLRLETDDALALINSYGTIKANFGNDTDNILKELEALRVESEIIVNRLQQLLGIFISPVDNDLDGYFRSLSERAKFLDTVEMISVKINIRIETLQPGCFILSYQIAPHLAGWYPSYDIRGLKNGNVKLIMYGKVHQQTEEDWRQVNVYLSTANITEFQDIPHLPTQAVEFEKPIEKPPQMRMARAMMASEPYSVMQDSIALQSYSPVPDMTVRTSTVEGSGSNVSYRISGVCTITSDTHNHKVTITNEELSCSYIRYCIPSEKEAAFILGHLYNKSDFHFLESSDISVYLNDAYAGKSDIKKRISPGEYFTISFGIDYSISIVHVRKHSFGKEMGLISKTGNKSFESLTYVSLSDSTLTSTLMNSIHKLDAIIIVSAIPVSKESQIIVNITQPSRPETISEPDDLLAAAQLVQFIEPRNQNELSFINTNTNHVYQVLRLKPNQKMIAHLGYTISWPIDKHITILDTII